jgi:hypothetical protein
MKKVMLWLLTLAFVMGGSGAVAWAQPAPSPASDPAAAARELAELNRSVKEMVTLLRQYLDNQQADLMFKRVELSLRRMGPLQEELSRLRTRRVADEGELNQIRTALSVLGTFEPQEGLGDSGEEPVSTVQKAGLDAQLKSVGKRISEADQQILELENRLAQEQRVLQTWETAIEQRLNSRPGTETPRK